ncbi:right-handed parallel beta-helix repeat-containing protein [Thioclava sp. F36-7]|uniref:right-handed parallel beta-helix repeat-containing protein n=1 Tax=Thioclava sp. F36-7 TaxID=1915317 RepID=UPI000997E15D|nr:right-handed parallel beta-helix repeat-containing protein [Thioclava sp. F36-7]OOY07642.1 hypothetical protein BMI89_16265 [Thioclava sp. F36-7]
MEQIAFTTRHAARVGRRGLLAVGLLVLGALPAIARDWQVSDTAGLARIGAKLAPGDTVLIAPSDYDALDLRGLTGREDAPITFRSADPDNRAVIAQMNLREVSHVVIEAVTFDYRYSDGDRSNTRPFQVFTTRDLTIRDVLFDGDLAPADPDLIEQGPLPTAFGLAVRASTGITVERSEFRRFYRGGVFTDCTDLRVVGNDIHDMRMDGLNFAQIERAEIANNHIHDFRRAVASGDHADMIQFWTAGTERPSRDIAITNNLLNSGEGGFTQSILMRNELVDRGKAGAEMFYRNIEISGNVIINAHLHGITVGEAEGVKIANNTLIHDVYSEGEKRDPVLWIPQIRVARDARAVEIARNAVSEIAGPAGQPDWKLRDNLLIQDITPQRASYYDQLFVAARTGAPREIMNYAYLPGGALAGSGIGAPMLDILGGPEALQPVMRFARSEGGGTTLQFDARESVLPEGVDPAEVAYRWGIDGQTSLDGAQVPVGFRMPGRHKVTLSLTLPDGRSAQSSGYVMVRDDRILSYDPDLGRVISHAGAQPEALDSIPLSPGALEFGLGGGAVVIPREMVAPLYGADRFALHMKLRAVGDYKSAGELLRLHQSLIVRVTGRGTFEVEFWPESGQRLFLRTKRVPIYDGKWHDITFRYASEDSLFEVLSGEEVIGKGTVSGRLKPMEYWGLALGNPFGKGSFHGEIEVLDLTASRPAVSGAMR